jgi:diguanylate cyclase (GGDEF)-like protein/PAS domain S-box-containing protein
LNEQPTLAPRDAGPLPLRVAAWHARALMLVRGGGLALASLLMAFAGALALPSLAPWSAVALPAGLALAARWRGGLAAWAGSLIGLLMALLSLGQPPLLSLLCTAAVAAGTAAGWLVLRHLRFDIRLDRAHDVAALVSVVMSVVAPPVALVTAAWLGVLAGASSSAGRTGTWLSQTGAGWLAICLGTVAATAAALALDRSLLNTPQRVLPGWRSARGLLGLALAAALVSWATEARSPALVALGLVGAPVLLALLALREQFTWASCGVLIVGLLAASGLGGGPLAGPGPAGWPVGMAHAVLAVWLAGTLGLVLLAHANTVQWRARSQRWEWALDGSRLGVADWHLDSGESFASAAWRTLSGHASPVWTPAAWRARLHPEDQPLLDEAVQALSSGSAGRRELELRIPAAGGGWRWAEATLMVIERDGAGHPLRLLATLSDMHDKRQALERQRLSASLFQHLHEGLLITDPDLRALDVNPAYTQILGVPREELIGTVPSLLRPAPEDPVAREQRAAMWASLRDHGHWRGELLERRRDGTACMLHATISTVPAPAGSSDPRRYHVLVISDVTEQHSQRDQLERQAHFDALTRLPNRTRLSALMDEAMQAADRDGYLLVVCYLDLDRFKPVNDRHGHAAGDRLLAELADRLRSALRSREHWTDIAARLGGDEFVMLLRAGTLEEGRLAVERVLRVVSQPYVVDPAQEPVFITASMGATVYPIDRSDADTLLRHADHAMYGAKQAGRNGYLFFDPEHRRRAEQRVMALGRIQEALDQQEFVLFYQPKVDMASGRVLGFEALLRWEHPQQGLVAPLQFLPLIETTGLSSSVGDWVLSRALEHLASWRRDGFDFSVSVNVSARHLQEPDFAQRLGYSTLAYLKRLPVDVLKIDRSFVHHMLDDTQDRAIVEGVIGLARTFGCTVVAEGVEHAAQARTLLELGCRIGQGTGIAAPMPVEQVAAWVRSYAGILPAEAAAGAG